MRPVSPPPAALQQSDRFAAALRLVGREAHIERLFDIGQALVITRRVGPVALRFTSRGPTWQTDTPAFQKVQALRQSRLHLVNDENTGAEVLHAAGYRQIITPASCAVLATGEKSFLESQASQKWRNRARLPERNNIVFTQQPFDITHHRWLLEADYRAQRAKGYKALPQGFVLALAKVAPKATPLFLAVQDSTAIAAMLFIEHDTTATYQIGWTCAAGRAVSAHHGLLVYAAAALARSGVAWIDLGTVDTETSPGLARFKLGSGARLHPLGGTWLRLPGL